MGQVIAVIQEDAAQGLRIYDYQTTRGTIRRVFELGARAPGAPPAGGIAAQLLTMARTLIDRARAYYGDPTVRLAGAPPQTRWAPDGVHLTVAAWRRDEESA